MTAANTSGFEATTDGSSTTLRRRLISGLYLHLAIFIAATLVLFLANSSTRGPDGEWWVIWPIQIWAVAWGLHLWGVSLAAEATRPAS